MICSKDITNLKSNIIDKIGQKIIVKGSLGRNKSFEKEARRYEKDTDSSLVIFAGACQSYFEALMQAGANFASSPARILIDILDPLIVAKEVAITDDCKYVKIEDIENKLRDGKRGIGGTGARRKKKEKYITKYRKCWKCVFYICL